MSDYTPKPGFSFPAKPSKEALGYFRAKKLRPGFDWRDVWREEHATNFTIAKAMQHDVLTDIRQSLDDALSDGIPFAQFKKDLKPTLQAKGWWGVKDVVDPLTGETVTAQLGSPRRLKTIYQANMRTARAAGQWQRAQRTKRTHPYFVYELGPSENHRPEHVAWAGLMLPVDHPFWQSHYPPNGWGCKCRIRQVSKREYDRLNETGNYLTEAPTIEQREWLNKRTGEVTMVPRGIDPGWDTNPGLARKTTAERQLNEKKAAATRVIKAPLPDAPPSLWPQEEPMVFSTIKGIDQAGITDVIKRVPGAEKQVAQLSQFLEAHPIKTVVIKAAEMARGKSAYKIEREIGGFLGDHWKRFAIGAFTMGRPTRALGFTNRQFDHVVVKARAAEKLSKADPTHLAAAVEVAVKASQGSARTWAIPDEMSGPAQTVGVWTHEMGHQVHYKAGAPKRPAGLPALTRYSEANDMEWHAEHFAAWLLNRDALAKWDKSVAEYIDKLVTTAVK